MTTPAPGQDFSTATPTPARTPEQRMRYATRMRHAAAVLEEVSAQEAVDEEEGRDATFTAQELRARAASEEARATALLEVTTQEAAVKTLAYALLRALAGKEKLRVYDLPMMDLARRLADEGWVKP